MSDSTTKDIPLNCDSTDNGDSDSSHGGSAFSMDETMWSFPRLEALRAANHIDAPHIVPMKLHHIVRRKTADNSPFYRVRVCRNCTSSDDTIYLGSYTDLESAILVNDAHELMHNRNAHTHVMTPQDMHFVESLTVTRTWRNNTFQVNLLHLLQERLSRNNSLPARDAVLQHDSLSSKVVPFLDITTHQLASGTSSATTANSATSYATANTTNTSYTPFAAVSCGEASGEEDPEGTLALELKRFRSFRSQIQLARTQLLYSKHFYLAHFYNDV